MASAGSSKAAVAALIDPLYAPEPSQETGPGSHFGSTFAGASNASNSPSTPTKSSLASNNPFREEALARTPPQKDGTLVSERSSSRGSPRSPHYRQAAFGSLDPPRQRSGSHGNTPPSYEDVVNSPKQKISHHRRTSSLRERYPGDESHKPLDIIRRDSKKADRSPHLKKRHIPGADTIDRLDPAIGGRAYHHEGPYDAALLARNSSFDSSPVAALQASNEETIKATPAENIKDAIERHRPLDGVAAIPTGGTDRFGRKYDYEEGADMLREPANDGPGYKRWDGLEYDPADLKGKGEPQFSLERAMREHKIDDGGIEMSERSHLAKDHRRIGSNGSMGADDQFSNGAESDVKRTGSLRAAGENLKKRIGSLRRKKADE